MHLKSVHRSGWHRVHRQSVWYFLSSLHVKSYWQKAKDITMSKNYSCQNVQVMTAWKYSLFSKIGSILLCSWMEGSFRFEANFHPTVEVKTFSLSLLVISSNVTLGYYINENWWQLIITKLNQITDDMENNCTSLDLHVLFNTSGSGTNIKCYVVLGLHN